MELFCSVDGDVSKNTKTIIYVALKHSGSLYIGEAGSMTKQVIRDSYGVLDGGTEVFTTTDEHTFTKSQRIFKESKKPHTIKFFGETETKMYDLIEVDPKSKVYKTIHASLKD